MATKFCDNCGKELELSAKFCGGCGNNMEEAPEPQYQPQPQYEPVPQAYAPPQEYAPQAYEEPQQPTRPTYEDEPYTYAEPYVETDSGEKKKFPLWLGLLLSATVILGAGAAVYFTLSYLENKPALSEEQPEEEVDEVEDETPEAESEPEIPEAQETEIPEVQPEPQPQPEPAPQLGLDMSNVARKELYVASAHASSTLPDWEHKSYGASNVLDGSTDTPWVENAPGIGIGEWIELDFGSMQAVQELEFYNGYGAVYDKNGIATKISITLSTGDSFTYNVSGHWNTIILPYALESSTIRLTILEAHSSGDQDTCISEMIVYNKSDQTPSTQAG